MDKTILRTCFLTLAVLLVSCKVLAQRYTTHKVKKGETLQSIAKQYRVTPYTLLQLNKELKSAEDLKPNTLLIIQTDGTSEPIEPEPTESDSIPNQIEPTGFTQHKVRRKETLYSITKRYEITEEQLKKYNKELYASSLKKGMVLQIPKYPEVEEEEPLDIETYVVQPKETRWSIAHKYGISVDSLVGLNPELSKTNSYLAAGQQLQLPRPKGDSLKDQEVALFESYTVPKSIGLFRVSQEYGIPTDSIIKLNPEIVEQNGLKEGMVLRLPKKQSKNAIVNTDNYIFYEVKPKQTVFSLTRNLKISRDSLYQLNPELENGLKAGMVLKLPKTKSKELEVKNALILDQINLIDSIDVTLTSKVLYLLPFRLDRMNLNDAEKTGRQIKRGLSGVKQALGLYTGAMVALDSLKKLGVSADVKFLDTQRNLLNIKNKLAQESLFDIDAVVGPIDPKLLGEVAVRSATHDIPVLAPYASKSDLSLNNVYFSAPDDSVLRKRILDHLVGKRKEENIIIIADAKHQVAKDSILTTFPMAREAKMSEDGSLHLIDFQAMLSETHENWVFVETNSANLAASVSSILNASNAEIIDETLDEKKTIVVKMFTTNYNSAFEADAVSSTHLSNLNFTFPSVYREVGNDSFTKSYNRKFGISPDRYAVRGFDMTLDLLLKLAHRKNLFETTGIIGQTEYSGNRFDYHNVGASGYFNRGTYLLHYEELRIKQIKAK